MNQKLTAETLKGNWATLLLPINSDDSIDYHLLAAEIDYLIAAGVDGIYSNGTAGEFHNQTEEEFDKINAILAERCTAAGMRFQIGASHPSPMISLERVKRSIDLKPDAVQVILPDWVTANQQEQISFLEVMAGFDVPLVLYNPPHAKTVLKPDEFATLKQAVPQLIGLKVLSGNEHWFADMKQYAGNLSVFVPGHLLASGVKNGVASGAYSNVACINPGAAQRWWAQMQTDIASALDVEQRILQFFGECIAPYQQKQYSNPALDKFLAAVGGWMPLGTRLRWPYQYISAEDITLVRKRAINLIPEFFNNL
ncbi:dihydrodipicolinate synthase family protein [Mucilaginibacter sabulilitoris]|uniref:Dihydrodipicolinate synthase family protein n=1 Tax=Mucilaginibacter sabulilitoris TaxID=1173583 RepID=A0ABZ0TIA2_9SPHI|nr:dihydrodipicolinate synthase family protein [Mucilaginibacter sabulilitoris]WPU92758.1 dihydrodipicolinate synthase family protein [Mucilaginibacter sabulilitoris]